MAYTKRTWTTGETITAAKLNQLEDGLAAAASVADEALTSEDMSAAVASVIRCTEQSLTTDQQTQARANIAAASQAALESAAADAVHVSSQSLTDAQKAQSRANIAAASQADAGALLTALKALCPLVTPAAAPVVAVPGAMPLNAEGLSVAIKPGQDLNGYDVVWANGLFADNLFRQGEISLTTTDAKEYSTSLADGTYTIWAEALSTNPDDAALYQVDVAYTFTSGGETMTGTIDLDVTSAAAVSGRAVVSGAISKISLTGGINGHDYPPTVRVIVLSGNVAAADIPPWNNICAITGRTGATLHRTGRNLFNESRILSATGWTYSNGVYSGSSKKLSDYFGTSNPIISFLTPQTVTLSFDYTQDIDVESKNGLQFVYYDADGNILERTYCKYAQEHVDRTVGNVSWIRCSYSNTIDMTLSNIMLVLGSEAASYEPYAGEDIAAAWQSEAGTVYGGSLNVLTGLLTVKWIREAINIDNITVMSYTDTYKNVGFIYVTSELADGTNRLDAISNIFATQNELLDVRYYNVPSIILRSNTNNTYKGVLFNLPYSAVGKTVGDGKTAEVILPAAKAYLNGLGTTIYVAYPLKTPLTYQLTAHPMLMADGYNAVWTDAGNVVLACRVNPYTALMALIDQKASLPGPDDFYDYDYIRPVYTESNGHINVNWVNASDDVPTPPVLNA